MQGDIGSLAVPPTVSALIEARLERLPPEELGALELASVEGKTFHRGAVLALSSAGHASDISPKLLALVRRDLIRPGESLFVGEDAFAFRNLLIRDAAYARISKEARAELHERYAGWLDGHTEGREGEFDEIVGYHLEQASRLRAEIAPGDERADAVGRAAVSRLGVAGRRAFDRGDLRAAVSLLGRADALLTPTSSERTPFLLDLGVALEREGRYEEAIDALVAAERLAREAGERGSIARAIARRQFVRSHIEGTPQAELESELEPLLPGLEKAGEDAAVAEVCAFLGVSLMWRGSNMRALEMLERAQALALRSGDDWLTSETASWIPAVLSAAPIPTEAARRRWREMRDAPGMTRYARAFGDALDAHTLAMMGRLDEARAQWREAQSVMVELGDATTASAMHMQSGYIELTAGDFAAAEGILAEGDRRLERLGEGGYRSTVLCFQADAIQALGRSEEAIAVTERAERISFPDDFETNSGWRAARGRALADLGAYDEGERFVREALEEVAPTDSIETQARSWSSLGYVLASAGRTTEAVDAYRDALERFEGKGCVPSAERVRRTIALLRGEAPGAEAPPPGAWGTTWPLR